MVPSLGTSHTTDRLHLQNDLLSAVKSCQTRFGGRSELATELDSTVVLLCNALEAALCHGLRNKGAEKKASAIKQVTELVTGSAPEFVTLWEAIRGTLTHHERERYELLRQVWTDRGRGRAWLRSALNERSLERYLGSLLVYDGLPTFYEDWAFVRDPDTSSILPNMAAGLGSILFAMSIDRPELNHVNNTGLQSVSLDSTERVIQEPIPISAKRKQEGRKLKRPSPNIISFGDDEENMENNHPIDSQHHLPSQDAEVVECAEEATVAIYDLDLSNSDTDQAAESDYSAAQLNTILRPVNNTNIGELIPVSLTEETQSSEDSVSVPSVSEENEVTSTANEKSEPSACVESLQKQVEKLRLGLEQANDLNTTLRSQIIQSNQHYQKKQHEFEMKIQELNRENELLKHQLRKYVSAVQMLKQESHSLTEDDNLFEQKLVQVAEMHGELMELNERLQRNLVGKEGIIRRLYMELEALRGPLGPTEVDIHTQIINLWVPSVFLTGNNKPYHVYQVHIRIGDEEWNVYRRYAQFHLLHKEYKKQFPVISAFQFPPKKTIGNKDAKFVEERRLKLQQYLRRLLNHLVANNSPLANSPTKSLLASTIPFFGEQNEPMVQRRRPCVPRPNPAPSTPQYSGL